MKKISVISAAYNADKCLEELIKELSKNRYEKILNNLNFEINF